MNKDTKGLFRISEAARASGVSRSTLMRLENKDLLRPSYIDPASGRRYYNIFDIGRVTQILKFKEMGFGDDEIKAYFSLGGEADGLLDNLNERLSLISEHIEEIEMRSMRIPNISVKTVKLPGVVCRISRHESGGYSDRYDALYELYSECIKEGYTFDANPIFIMSERDDYLRDEFTGIECPYYACIPVTSALSSPDIMYFPPCTAVSVLFYSYEYAPFKEAWLALGKAVRESGLTPVGLPRTLGIVAPITGTEIDSSKYCSRIVQAVRAR